MTYHDLSESYPCLKVLSTSLLTEPSEEFRLRTCFPHEVISQKGAALTQIGILASGTFRVVNELENGNVFMIEMNDAPSFVGEVTLLAGEYTTSVTIEAVSECIIAFLPVSIFSDWIEKNPALLRYISRHVAKKLYCSSYHRGERNFYSAQYVLLNYLLEHIDITKSTEPAVMHRTRQQMSEEIGMSVNTINRHLLTFRKEGLISMIHGKVTQNATQRESAKDALQIYIAQNRNGAREKIPI
ncbi:Crp/Fnr family transcriptional regulator [Porcincola intestinalis]|jgi:CRP/FNR family cyclic AMP-dependent transcriptional regulator|uniref:Crp/Fnr family transcriptional regulator n=1 Tax=Porcincola intestinalis TaxID=2606632 RepID=A0A6L5X9U4_9FIRM|nr:Crp/Fnr family transcriptional regulator [Porcincola intestinalis]MSS15252.1 Crp/Fnr family transcriptional regulator [Porcincola intestinalis]